MSEIFPAYYDSSRNRYLVQDNRETWIAITKEDLKLRLNFQGLTSDRKGKNVSPADKMVLRVQDEQNVLYAGPLAGFKAGPIIHNGIRILVTHSPKVQKPCKGEWKITNQFITGLYGHPNETFSQYARWHAHAKLSYQQFMHCVETGNSTFGQALFLAGPVNCGKSVCQKYFTHIIGGRSASPFDSMSSETKFNRELFGAEHQMVEDEQAFQDFRSRARFGTEIKKIAANESQACKGKNLETINLTPFWRFSLSLNDDEGHIEVMPPLEGSLLDKVLCFHCKSNPMPMPSVTPEERKKFMGTLIGELPAYLWWLENEFEIPEEIVDKRRYGVKAFVHPTIASRIKEFSVEHRLICLVDAYLLPDPRCQPFEGTAEELITRLLDMEESKLQSMAFLNCAGRILGRARDSYPDRVQEIRTSTRRLWRIIPAGQKPPVTPTTV